MKMSDRGLIALIGFEGVVLGPYRDSKGVWTYGIGHTALAGRPFPRNMKRGTRKDTDAALRDIFALFRSDVERYEADVRRALTVDVRQHEFDAAVSFHYNTGAIGRAAWVRSLNSGRRAQAATGFMNWSRPPEIIGRRKAERLMFQQAVYPDAVINVWGADIAGDVIWEPVRRISPSAALLLLNPEPPPFAGIFNAIRGMFGR